MSNTVNFTSAADFRNSSEYRDTSVAGQFTRLAKDVMIANDTLTPWGRLHEKYAADASYAGRITSLAKAAVSAAGTTNPFDGGDGQALSEAYIRAVAPDNLVDAVARYALPVDNFQQRAIVAAGVVAEEVGEGAAKPVTPLTIDAIEPDQAKIAAMLVVTAELLQATTSETDALFRRLLRDAVIRASNAALLSRLSTTPVAAGADAVASLRAGLAAADDSEGYVVAATGATVRALALASDGRMGVNGGEFIPGVHVLAAVEASSASPDMIVIPASGIALTDTGLELRSAGHASIQMDTDPDNPTAAGTVLVNLWQRNLRALLVERRIAIRSSVNAIEVG